MTEAVNGWSDLVDADTGSRVGGWIEIGECGRIGIQVAGGSQPVSKIHF